MNRRLRFSALLTLAFLAGTGLVACRHELWRDEMQAWLIARDSPNLWTLCLQGRYDGTPPLWYLLLRPLTLITHRPEAMQVLNWGLAGLTFFLICHFAPFSRLQKVLLLFNYYLFFEYGTVCRQYLPGVLLLSAACILFPSAGKRPWAFTAALAAAAMASVYSLILAAAMGAAFWGAGAGAFRPGANHGKSPARHRLSSFLVFAGGVAVAIYCMLPEPDTFYAPADGWHFGWNPDKMARVGCAFTNALFLLPRPEGYFWIPAWLTAFSPAQYLAAGLSVPLFAGALLLLGRSAPAVFFYVVAILGVSLFLYSKYLGFTRHAGFLFIAFLVALWLKKRLATARPAPARTRWIARSPEIALTLVLATQAVTGAWAAGMDFNRPFSRGAKAAHELTGRHLEKGFIAAWPDSVGTVLAGYLDRSIYYPQSGRWGSFVRWDRRRNERMTDAEALQLAEREAGNGPIVIVLDHELVPEIRQAHGMAVLGYFQGSLVPFEDYFVYYKPEAGPPTGPS